MAPFIENAVAQDLEQLVADLLDEALVRWAATNWQRYDNLEINCTMQVYRWAEDASRSIPRLRVLSAVLEWSQPTPAMIRGTESGSTMVRPDLRVRIGSAAGATIECKRLGSHHQLPELYVDEGIARFVVGDYAIGEPVGFMIGYIQDSVVGELVGRINARVAAHPSMGDAEQLVEKAAGLSSANRYGSSHQRATGESVRLEHYLPELT